MSPSVSTTSSASTAPTTMHCSRHRAVATGLRCDRCYQPFCRDCLVSRFITSRSAVWLCHACARSGSPYRGNAGASGGGRSWSGGGSGGGGGLIRHPRALGGRDLRYWLAAAGIGALILYGALQQGLLPF
jgi:hypothetical protein